MSLIFSSRARTTYIQSISARIHHSNSSQSVTYLVNECQKGMVFSINANPDSAKSFSVFQANAEASIAPAAKVNKKPRRTHPRDFAYAAN
ncbi:hypothetical protein B0H14DRAFT_2749138 [Mycena olivaceomarginata]|nr:hypothetical protein B0H14DRAFT_2749138 [Mycena olivaceomarginata]